MGDFSKSDLQQLLFNRFIVVIGDSVQRCVYKDLVLLLQENRHLTEAELKKKGELSFLNDDLIEGGCKEEMSNGTSYREVRQYKTDVHLVRFYFVTRCYSPYFETILNDLQMQPCPDIVIMNSCLWDITRYGINSISDYKQNLVTLFDRFSEALPQECLIIWNTTLPISSSARGGFLVPEIEFKSTTLRLDILEANYYTQQVATDHGCDVLDLHFYLRHHLGLRVRDGIHWNMIAHRNVTHLILSHIHEAWGIPLPDRETTFGSYGSTYARSGYYQELMSQNRLPLSTPVLLEQLNFQTSCLLKTFLLPTPQNFTCDNAESWHNKFMSQPYQQSLPSRPHSSHTRSRYTPYAHRRY